ncbi:hypothetical protein ACIF80_06660 [Streptomyces sp. NPDC085927]|uniref:hypothetical protein n=1 Tax=Streptomyces sp. NPDC085927 TaxID=3365738 RepID=UPI0037D4830E
MGIRRPGGGSDERGLVDDVIDPAETRTVLVRSLAMPRTENTPLPERTHGNPPM